MKSPDDTNTPDAAKQESEKPIQDAPKEAGRRFSLIPWLKEHFSHQWIMNFLTLFLVISTTIFNWVQSCTYEKSTKANLRAYVVLDQLNLDKLRIGETPMVSYEIKNVGKTPAYRVNVIGSELGNEKNLIFDFDSLQTAFPDTGFVASPNIPISGDSFFQYEWTPADSIAFLVGGSPLYYIVGITYLDIFGQGHHAIAGSVYSRRTKNFVSLRHYQYAD
ncbi:MAG: hypothetical protein ABSF91_13110 [Bacteroidota bacterium]|jgi:hypothetical protein